MKYFIGVILAVLANFSLATELDEAKIINLMLDKNHPGKIFLTLDKRQSPTISCHTSSWEYVLDITDEHGKYMYSALLATYSSGNAIYFRGTDNCSIHGNIETLRRVELK